MEGQSRRRDEEKGEGERRNGSTQAREHTYLEQWSETNRRKFNKVLYLDGAKNSVHVQGWGNLI